MLLALLTSHGRRLAAKNIKVSRPTLFNYVYTREEFTRYATELWRLILHENFNVNIFKTYDLKNVAQAHEVRCYSKILSFVIDAQHPSGPGGKEDNGKAITAAII